MMTTTTTTIRMTTTTTTNMKISTTITIMMTTTTAKWWLLQQPLSWWLLQQRLAWWPHPWWLLQQGAIHTCLGCYDMLSQSRGVKVQSVSVSVSVSSYLWEGPHAAPHLQVNWLWWQGRARLALEFCLLSFAHGGQAAGNKNTVGKYGIHWKINSF